MGWGEDRVQEDWVKAGLCGMRWGRGLSKGEDGEG